MTTVPTILAFDAATGACSVAVLRGQKLLAERAQAPNSAQSRLLVPMMQQAMGEAGITYSDLSLIVCTTGPGSFTGIRIGLATARAAGLAAGVKVRGVSSFAVLAAAARQHSSQRPIVCLMQAGKNQLYAQSFAERPLDEGRLVDIPALADYVAPRALLCGNAARAILTTLPGKYHLAEDAEHPQARHAAALAAGSDADAWLGEPSPLYIRPPDAIVPLKPITAG